MVGKNVEDMYNRLDTTPAYDRQTDGLTDILPRHSPRFAYASRGKKLTCSQLSLPHGINKKKIKTKN